MFNAYSKSFVVMTSLYYLPAFFVSKSNLHCQTKAFLCFYYPGHMNKCTWPIASAVLPPVTAAPSCIKKAIYLFIRLDWGQFSPDVEHFWIVRNRNIINLPPRYLKQKWKHAMLNFEYRNVYYMYLYIGLAYLLS